MGVYFSFYVSVCLFVESVPVCLSVSVFVCMSVFVNVCFSSPVYVFFIFFSVCVYFCFSEIRFSKDVVEFTRSYVKVKNI